MYTKRPIPQKTEPLRLPEHYDGIAFSRKGSPSIFPQSDEQAPREMPTEESEQSPKEPPEQAKNCSKTLPADTPPQKQHSFSGISGREDILLLVLALLLLDDEGGDDMLAYILLGLLFLG